MCTQRAKDNKQTHVGTEATPAPTTLRRPMRSAICRAGYRPKGKISPPLQWLWLICSPGLPAATKCLVTVRTQTVWNGGSILLEISRNYRTVRLRLLPVEGALADVQAQLGDIGKRTCAAIAWCRKTCYGNSCTDRQCFASLSGSAPGSACNACERFGRLSKPKLFPCSLHDCTHNKDASIVFPLSPHKQQLFRSAVAHVTLLQIFSEKYYQSDDAKERLLGRGGASTNV